MRALNSVSALSTPLSQPGGHVNKQQDFSPLVDTRSLKLILLPSADRFLILHLNDSHMQGTVTRSEQNYSTKKPSLQLKKYKYENRETASKFTSASLHYLHW